VGRGVKIGSLSLATEAPRKSTEKCRWSPKWPNPSNAHPLHTRLIGFPGIPKADTARRAKHASLPRATLRRKKEAPEGAPRLRGRFVVGAGV
jgi:hypothetical protein